MTIRSARPEDAPALAALAGELGYPARAGDIELRIVERLDDPDLAVFVAEEDGVVVAWIDVADRETLYGGRNAEIQGLVITELRRRGGIGSALVEHAEEWARRRGIGVMRVRSRSDRDGAHGFYADLGYSVTKNQTVFEKRF